MSLDFCLEAETELYSGNITHNLGRMAEEAGIYMCLWRPHELYKNPTAEKLVQHLESGLLKLRSHPDHYRQFDSPNGWGTYENFVPFVEEVLKACKKHPKANVMAYV